MAPPPQPAKHQTTAHQKTSHRTRGTARQGGRRWARPWAGCTRRVARLAARAVQGEARAPSGRGWRPGRGAVGEGTAVRAARALQSGAGRRSHGARMGRGSHGARMARAWGAHAPGGGTVRGGHAQGLRRRMRAAHALPRARWCGMQGCRMCTGASCISARHMGCLPGGGGEQCGMRAPWGTSLSSGWGRPLLFQAHGCGQGCGQPLQQARGANVLQRRRRAQASWIRATGRRGVQLSRSAAEMTTRAAVRSRRLGRKRGSRRARAGARLTARTVRAPPARQVAAAWAPLRAAACASQLVQARAAITEGPSVAGHPGSCPSGSSRAPRRTP